MNNEPTLCPLGTKLAQSLRCQEKSWHLFLCFFALQKIISKIMSDFVSPNTEYMQLFLFVLYLLCMLLTIFRLFSSKRKE